MRFADSVEIVEAMRLMHAADEPAGVEAYEHMRIRLDSHGGFVVQSRRAEGLDERDGLSAVE